MMGRRIVKQAKDLIYEKCKGAYRFAPFGRPRDQAPLDVGPASLERSLELAYDHCAHRHRVATIFGRQRVDPVGYGAPVDDRPARTQGRKLHGHAAYLVARGLCDQLFQAIEVIERLPRGQRVGVDRVERGAQRIWALILLRCHSGKER